MAIQERIKGRLCRMVEIKELKANEFEDALNLAWAVFQEYESPEYSAEGIRTFHDCLLDPDFVQMLKIYGAFAAGKIIGMLATRDNGNHIALFFVDGNYHKRGVGRLLFEKARADNIAGKMTVNSSPYAVTVYRHLGFLEMAEEQLTDGIRYTPMCYDSNY